MDANGIDLMCREIVELVTDYLTGALAAGDRVRFEKHLLTCPPCTAYLAQMRTTIALAGGLGDGSAAEEAGKELVGLFRRWHGK